MAHYRRLPLARLVIDPTYQRELEERRVEHMAKNYNEDMIGALEVSAQGGDYVVFDGQHRLAMLRLLGETSAPCLVHENLGQKQEAALFYKLQKERKAVHPVQMFRAQVVAAEPEALDLQRILDEAGFEVGYHKQKAEGHRSRVISAVGTLRHIHARGNLPETLALLRLWDGDIGATDSMFMEGVSLLQRDYGRRIGERERSRLQRYSAVILARNALSKQARAENLSTSTRDRARWAYHELRKAAGFRRIRIPNKEEEKK